MKCSACGSTSLEHYEVLVCTDCGEVIGESVIEDGHVEFVKVHNDRAHAVGTSVSTHDASLGGILVGSGRNDPHMINAIRHHKPSNNQQRHQRARNEISAKIMSIGEKLRLKCYHSTEVFGLLERVIDAYNRKMEQEEYDNNNHYHYYDENETGYTDDSNGNYNDAEQPYDFFKDEGRDYNEDYTQAYQTSTRTRKRTKLSFTQKTKIWHIAVACMYVVCRTQKIPLMLIDITNEAGLNLFKVGREYKMILNILEINLDDIDYHLLVQKYINDALDNDYKYIFQKSSDWDSVNNNIEPASHYLDDFQAKREELMPFSIRLILEKKSCSLIDLAIQECLDTGRKPQALVAAAIKLAAESLAYIVRFEDIAHVAGTGQVAVRERYRELVGFFTSIVSSLPYDVTSKTLHRHLDFLIKHQQHLRELSVAQAKYKKEPPPKNETKFTTNEGKEVPLIVLDSDDEEEEQESSNVQNIAAACSDNTDENALVVPKAAFGHNNTKADTMKFVNQIKYSTLTPMPSSFVKSQLMQAQVKQRIAENRAYLENLKKVSLIKPTAEKEEVKEDEDLEEPCQPEFDNVPYGVMKSLNATLGEPILSLIPPPSVSAYEASLLHNHRRPKQRQQTIPTHTTRKETTKQTDELQPKKRKLASTDDLRIRQLLLSGATDSEILSNSFRSKSTINSSHYSVELGDQDMTEDEYRTYVHNPEEVLIRKRLRDELGDDDDDCGRKKQRRE